MSCPQMWNARSALECGSEAAALVSKQKGGSWRYPTPRCQRHGVHTRETNAQTIAEIAGRLCRRFIGVGTDTAFGSQLPAPHPCDQLVRKERCAGGPPSRLRVVLSPTLRKSPASLSLAVTGNMNTRTRGFHRGRLKGTFILLMQMVPLKVSRPHVRGQLRRRAKR